MITLLVDNSKTKFVSYDCYLFILTLERPRWVGGGGGSNEVPIGFLDLKFEAFKQSKWNFQYL